MIQKVVCDYRLFCIGFRFQIKNAGNDVEFVRSCLFSAVFPEVYPLDLFALDPFVTPTGFKPVTF